MVQIHEENYREGENFHSLFLDDILQYFYFIVVHVCAVV